MESTITKTKDEDLISIKVTVNENTTSYILTKNFTLRMLKEIIENSSSRIR